jgi:hypothetical protein
MEIRSLFHKKATMNFIEKRSLIFSFWAILGVAAICVGQESPAAPSKEQDPDGLATHDVLQTGQEPKEKEDRDADQPDRNGEGYRTQDILIIDQKEAQSPNESQAAEEPIPIPINAIGMQDEKTLGGQSLIDDVFRSRENRFGFSLGAYQAYTSDIGDGSHPGQSSGIAAFMPRAFFNFGKQKSQFHIDLGTGYRHYYSNSAYNSWDYYAAADYSYAISKRSRFGISDQFTSSYNDAWWFINLNSPIYYDPKYSNEVIFNRQRITRNSLNASYDYRVSRKGELQIFGRYGFYLYPQNTLSNANVVEAGASFDYRFTKWLSLTNSYSVYLYKDNEQFQDSRVHSLRLGGLEFDIGRSWRIWLGGGAGFTNRDDKFYIAPDVNAGIGYTSRNCDFSVTYRRGFTSAIGLSQLTMSDVVSANFGYRLTSRISASLESYYYRSSELDRDGVLETLSGGGGLQFALTKNFVASVNGAYQDQRSHQFSVQGLDINRFTVSAGLTYMWPSRKSTGY